MKVLFHCVKPFVDVATGYTKRFDIIGDRPHVLRQGGERELGDPAPCLTQPPGDRQRDQAAPGQAQEEHQEHVGVRVISHYSLDYVSLDKYLQVVWRNFLLGGRKSEGIWGNLRKYEEM